MSKKLWCRPMRSSPSTSAQISASSSSTGPDGPSVASPALQGTGSALRSTLPLGVSGSAGSTTKADGTNAGGRRDRRYEASSPSTRSVSAT